MCYAVCMLLCVHVGVCVCIYFVCKDVSNVFVTHCTGSVCACFSNAQLCECLAASLWQILVYYILCLSKSEMHYLFSIKYTIS